MRLFHTISLTLFFVLGTIMLVGVAIIMRGSTSIVLPAILRSLDLPLLLTGLLTAATGLLLSMRTEHPPRVMTLVIAVLSGGFFLFALWLNFGLLPRAL